MDKLSVPAPSLLTGVVRFFNESKGFGLITPDTGGPDLFMQAAQIRTPGVKKLRATQLVSYEKFAGPDGDVAMNVRLA